MSWLLTDEKIWSINDEHGPRLCENPLLSAEEGYLLLLQTIAQAQLRKVVGEGMKICTEHSHKGFRNQTKDRCPQCRQSLRKEAGGP